MAAGLALKNSFSSREIARLREVQARWAQGITQETRNTVKELALKALATADTASGTQAAQFIASIAAIELPRSEWPELMHTLVANVSKGTDTNKQSSLATIGFICEMQDKALQQSLTAYANGILTAVVQGARKEEPNDDVRTAAMAALGDSLEFVRANFEDQGERNYIMQVVCEATQASDPRVQQGAYGCLNRIMAIYYDKMAFYMEKALFGLTALGMKNEDEDVAKLAIEFWCTVCEEEISIEDDNNQAEAEQQDPRPFYNFARIATGEIVPILLELLTKQDEDAPDDEYNVPRAAYQCLQLYSNEVGNTIVPHVLQFVEQNIRSEDWHFRDAAVSSLGAVMDGPEEETLMGIVKQALPVLIPMMEDQNVQVRDSVAYTIGRISDNVPAAIDVSMHLAPLVAALFNGLASNPKIAASSCWALMNLAEKFAGKPGALRNPLTQHFEASVRAVLQATERPDQDSGLRTAAYEVLSSFVFNAAEESVPMIASLSEVILQRLQESVPLRQQLVSVEDRLTLDDMQTSLCGVVLNCVARLGESVKPLADRVMQVLLEVLTTLSSSSSVADSAFAAVGSLANGVQEDFLKYMDAFNPFLLRALSNKDDIALCAMSIGLVSDIVRALGSGSRPYCDQFMNSLLENLGSPALSSQCKPAILQCFGDIAQAIGPGFETYLQVVAQVLDQATKVTVDPKGPYELLDYLVALREGIMDAWAGAIIAMKSGNKGTLQAYHYIADNTADLLKPYMDHIFHLIHIVSQDQNRSEGLVRSTLGVIGYVRQFCKSSANDLATLRMHIQTVNSPITSVAIGFLV